jgi:hypothetical protein
MERKRVDLKLLPIWLQYVIAITITLVVVALAWRLGRDRPIPNWMQTWLVPGLGWAGLVLLVTGVGARILEKKN